MHALAVSYRPAPPARRRPAWDDAVIDPVERFLPASEGVAKERYRAACAHVRSLPTDASGYDLIHFDAHGGNGTVDEDGRITLFDCDDCCHSWYINDLAIALAHVTLGAPDPIAATRAFLPDVLRGYRTAYALDPAWIREMPVFLKMAEIFTYAVVHRDGDVDDIADIAFARFMRGHKDGIENDVPYLDVDFGAFAAYL